MARLSLSAAWALCSALLAGCMGKNAVFSSDAGTQTPAAVASAGAAPAREPATPAAAPAKPPAEPAPPPAPPPPPPPYRQPVPAPSGALPKAKRYANLSPAQCRAELAKRKLEVRPAGGAAKGIAVPLRISGPLSGVKFVTPGARSVFGKLDCRLALALDDMAAVLKRHAVAEVRIDNMYRPRARLPRVAKGRRRKPSQHSYGLAADVLEFKLEDGRVLDVERDWHGAIDGVPCGPDATLLEPDEASLALRNMICALAAEHLFNHILTPNYNQAHRDHVHIDIKRDAREIEIR